MSLLGTDIVSPEVERALTSVSPTVGLSSSENGLRKRLYIFYSFDLVNSTRYKALFPSRWPETVRTFYELVTMRVASPGFSESAFVWKFVGDEVLFWHPLRSRKALIETPNSVLRVLRDTVRELHEKWPDSRHILNVKATMWCAAAFDEEPGVEWGKDGSPRNLRVRPDQQNPYQVDFIGPDIDIGFRVSKFSEPSRLAMSAALAYIIYNTARQYFEMDEMQNVGKRLRIVTLQRLKGVWSDLHYPVLWYEEDWSKVEGSFKYDEHLTSELVKHIKESIGKLEGPDKLAKIYGESGQHALEIRLLDELMDLLPQETPAEEDAELRRYPQAELHCVAICVDAEDRVFVRKRSKSRRVLPEFYDFSCAQLRAKQAFEEAIQSEYYADHGLKPSLIGNPPEPLATFEVQRNHEAPVPGIIFAAAAECEAPKSKPGDQVMWMSLAEIEGLEDNLCVDNLKANARAAIERVKAARDAGGVSGATSPGGAGDQLGPSP